MRFRVREKFGAGLAMDSWTAILSTSFAPSVMMDVSGLTPQGLGWASALISVQLLQLLGLSVTELPH